MVLTRVRVESTEVSDVSARACQCGIDLRIDARYENVDVYQLEDIKKLALM